MLSRVSIRPPGPELIGEEPILLIFNHLSVLRPCHSCSITSVLAECKPSNGNPHQGLVGSGKETLAERRGVTQFLASSATRAEAGLWAFSACQRCWSCALMESGNSPGALRAGDLIGRCCGKLPVSLL